MYNHPPIAIKFLLLVLLTSCTQQTDLQSSGTKIELNKLELVQTDKKGYKLWEISSTTAELDENTNQLQALNSRLTLYQADNAKYTINAELLHSINYKEQLDLEGNVVFKDLSDNSFKMTSNKLSWDPNNGIIVLTDNAKLFYSNNFVTADSIKYLQNTHDFIFTGNILYRININKSSVGASQPLYISLKAKQLSWNSSSGVMEVLTPFSGKMINDSKESDIAFLAESLYGNTNNKKINLSNCIVINQKNRRTTADICTFDLSFYSNDDSLLNLRPSTLKSNQSLKNNDTLIRKSRPKQLITFQSKTNSVRTTFKED